MEIQSSSPRVDYQRVLSEILQRKRLYAIVLPIVFVLSCIWILPQPRYYVSSTMVAPEGGSEPSASSLTNLASSFGFNLGGAQNDAIYPMLYPDLFSSPEFVVDLLSINVPALMDDGSRQEMSYYTYLTKYQQKNWLTYPFVQGYRTVRRWIKPRKPGEAAAGDVTKLDPFRLSYDDHELLEIVPKLIACSVDKKTDVTTISVTDQDALVSALLADSVRIRLQKFITDYRTAKARKDYDYYSGLMEKAREEYQQSAKTYAEYVDSHQEVSLQVYATQRDQLENDMGLKYETYSAMKNQVTAAAAKVQEKTPAFMVLQSPTVPVKPNGPKRMIFVAIMLVVGFFGTTIYVLRDIIKEQI